MAEQETSATYTVQINVADNNRGTIFCGGYAIHGM